jgi:L-erythro-3,5-diaminohexanoate dehydrogenase
VIRLGAEPSPADPAVLGIPRAVDPPRALPHIARVLDADTDASDYEAEIDVELLVVDATSYRTIRDRCNADPERMAEMIGSIVAERGKLQNPWTGSGGVLMGRVRRVGSSYRMRDLLEGELVVPLASLIAIPLALDAVGPIDPGSPLVPARGRAIVTGAMLCGRVPGDLPQAAALRVLDVYPVASHVRAMAAPGSHVLILGAGHAGLLAVAAAGEADTVITVVDVCSEALERAREIEARVHPIRADATDPLAVAGELAGPADLTLLCTTVGGCEGTAILATAPHGTVLFFSTATEFAAAALGADAIGSQVRLLIPNGLTEDRGEYAFELVRRNPALLAAFGGRA